MKYYVTINGTDHEVELEEHGGELTVHYNGDPCGVRFAEVDQLGQLALFVEDESYAVSIEEGLTPNETVVAVAGHLYDVTVEDERERAAHAADRAGGAGGGTVRSVMPGIVVELLVEEGAEVEAGQPLLILEAMKMQNEITAPQAGTVSRVHVAEGGAVGSGEPLVDLRAADAGS